MVATTASTGRHRRRRRRLIGACLLAIVPSICCGGNEVRAAATEVVVCGGSYNNTHAALHQELECDCTSTEHALVRLHSNAHLDLNGFTIRCRQGWVTMFSLEGDSNSVRNGRIEAEPLLPSDRKRGHDFAVTVEGSHNVIETLHIQRVPSSGIRVLGGSNNTVQSVAVHLRSYSGIELHGGSNHVIRDMSIHQCLSYGMVVHDGTNHTLIQNRLSFLDGPGILVKESSGIAIQEVTVSITAGGINIVGGNRNEVKDCDIDSRGFVPLLIEGEAMAHRLVGNSLSGKAAYAILIGENATNCSVVENTATREFHPFTRGRPVFYDMKDNCDLSSTLWVNNKGASVECGTRSESIPLSHRYAGRIFNFFTVPQYSVLAGTLMVTSLLSAIGSGTLIFLILSKNRTDVTVMHRILLGLCSADFVSALSGILQPILIPKETLLPLASGNMTSCRVVGFAAYFFFASTIYFCELALYFYLTIRHGWSEKRAAQRLEPWVHLLPWTVVLVHNIIGLAFNVFQPNAVLGLCLIGCDVRHGFDRCVPGLNPRVSKYMQIPASLIPSICAILGTTWTVGVFNVVREQGRKMRRYSFGRSTCLQKEDLPRIARRSSLPSTGTPMLSEPQRGSLRRRMSSIPGSLALSEDLHHKKTKAVAKQALCYCAAYLNSFVGVVVWTLIRIIFELRREMRLALSSKSTGLYVALIVVFSLHPLLGFLSWLTFVRPIVSSIQDSFPGKSWIWCYRKLLMGYQQSRSSRMPPQSPPRLSPIPAGGGKKPCSAEGHTFRGSIEMGEVSAESSLQYAAGLGDIRSDNSDLMEVQSTEDTSIRTQSALDTISLKDT